jgi:hypothetical protein
LNKLALACLDVKWEELPTKRVAGTRESKWDNWNFEKTGSSYDSHSSSDDYGYGWSSQKAYHDEDDYLYSSRSRKKTRRRGSVNQSKKTRTYYDNGGDLVEFTKSSKGVYDVYRDKFLASDLTRQDLEMIKEQYLDMSNPYDRIEYERLSQFL